MRVQLFVPCLVKDTQPEAAQAVLTVLEHLGLSVRHPEGQTCCGQLAYKSGDVKNARALARRCLEIFAAPEPVICPAGSCVKMLRSYPDLFSQGGPEREAALDLAARSFEFCEFVAGRPGGPELGARLNVRACYHGSCQMPWGQPPAGANDPPRQLLRAVRGLTLLEPRRADRCCGFGGIFSLQFSALSEALTEEKCAEILAREPDILVSAEPSCLMSLSGYLARMGKPLPALHVAQVLAAGITGGTPPWA